MSPNTLMRQIEIEGFRSFRSLRVEGLARVNLVVGKNNSGKTSLLEAVDLLGHPGDADPIWDAAARRGERTTEAKGRLLADVGPLFHGFEGVIGKEARIASRSAQPEQRECKIVLRSRERQQRLEFSDYVGNTPELRLAHELACTWSDPPSSVEVAVTHQGWMDYRSLRGVEQREVPLTRLVTSDALPPATLAALLGRTLLTDDEAPLLESLRRIEPHLERVAISVDENTPFGRGSVKARITGKAKPVYFGSLGEGMWRLLGVALSLVQTERVVLFDEVDTGLHFTVLPDLWTLVIETARRLDLQVIATTHSLDCLVALHRAAADLDALPEVSVQRLEAGSTQSVPFTGRQVEIAVQTALEIR